MTQQPKYNLGDEVWYMVDNKIDYSTIKGVAVSNDRVYDEEKLHVYLLNHVTYLKSEYKYINTEWYPESFLFPTKEELKASL